jgi:hypothetical protein
MRIFLMVEVCMVGNLMILALSVVRGLVIFL